jgi:hypothetical protein
MLTIAGRSHAPASRGIATMADPKKVLIPDVVVARKRYHVHPHTLRRWDKNPTLDFPPPVYVNGRRYREAEALDAWDRKNSREAAMRRAGLISPSPEAA